MTQATVGESCKGLHNALTNAIARRLPLGIARPLRIVRVWTYQMRKGNWHIDISQNRPQNLA
jgi:hypothetical protein